MSQPHEALLSDPIPQGDWVGWSKWKGEEPFEDHVGPFYVRRDSAGRMLCGCRVQSHNVRSGGVAHGGSLMSFADYALFLIAFDAINGADGVTVSFHADFLAPAPEGARLVARGEVMRGGRSLVFVRGQIDIDGQTSDACVLAFSGVIKLLRAR